MHLLSERLTIAETLSGEARKSAEDDCVRIILDLWKHREYFPRHRPLESFDRIFSFLASIQNGIDPWYAPRHEKDGEGPGADWIKAARSIDEAARVLIRWCVGKASEHASAEEEEWTEDGIPEEIRQMSDMELSLILEEEAHLVSGKTISVRLRENHEAHLNEMLVRVSRFVDLSKALQNDIETSLTRFKKGSAKPASKRASSKK